MFFRNLQIYRLPAPWAMTADALANALAPQAFAPASSNELVRQGWSAPRPNGGLVHTVNKQMLIKRETEKKLLPATVINQVAAARAAELEEAQGFAPGKKAMKELKERVADELLPRAFSIKAQTFVWIDPVNGWLAVDASSATKADEVIKMLLKSVDCMPLESLRVQRSPVGMMTGWLEHDEAPAGFTVDQDATLRATGESKAQVAYKKHTLDPASILWHIRGGKQCTRLAMTWDSKISFVLDESLAVKSVKPLDVLTENDKGAIRNDQERFDGDFMLMTGELAKMLADLVEALGGEATEGAAGEGARAAPAGQPKIERAVRLGAELYKQRALHRDVLGTLYEQTIEPYMARVRERMDEAGGALEAATALAKEQATGSTSAQLFLVAAVEFAEPSPRPAAGDEQVREQRVVTSLGADAPAGDGSASDPLYEQAVAVVRTNQRASVSLVQRHLKIGYNRASRLLHAMEGTVVGPMHSNGDRDLLE
jgi:DNA recombination-dependent growth factor C